MGASEGATSTNTSVFVMTQKMVAEFDEKMSGLLFRWHRLGYGGQMEIERPNGKKISYEGVGFDGSPRDVYWGTWSEDFFQDEVPKILSNVADLAIRAKEDVSKSVDEAVNSLTRLIEKFYSEMVSVDQRLMGDGVRMGVRRDATLKIESVKEYTRAVAELMRRMNATQCQQRLDANDNKELFGLRPSFLGFSIDLKELFRRGKRKVRSLQNSKEKA